MRSTDFCCDKLLQQNDNQDINKMGYTDFLSDLG